MDEKEKKIIKLKLENASKRGDLEEIKELVKQGAMISEMALFDAVHQNHLEVVEYFITIEPKLLSFYESVKNKIHKQLIDCCVSGDLKKIEDLFNNGINIHSKNEEAIISAARHNNLEIVKYLIDKGADIHAQNGEVLLVSVLNGHLEMVKYLLNKGCDVNTQNSRPLIYAVGKGDLEIVKCLIEKGGDPYLSILHAKNSNNREIIEWCESYIKSKDLKDKLHNELILKENKNTPKLKI